jgi:hypothetical protein
MTRYQLDHYLAGHEELPASFYLQGHVAYRVAENVEIFFTLRNARLGGAKPQYVFSDYARLNAQLGMRADF